MHSASNSQTSTPQATSDSSSRNLLNNTMNHGNSEPKTKDNMPAEDVFPNVRGESLTLKESENPQEYNGLKGSHEMSQSSGSTNAIDKKLMSKEGVSLNVPEHSRKKIVNELALNDKTGLRVKKLKKKTLKNSLLRTDKKSRRNASPSTYALHKSKSILNSSTKESGQMSRRTRCSYNPTFAQKQKNFLAMVSSSMNEEDSQDIAYENSGNMEIESEYNDSSVSAVSEATTEEDNKRIKSDGKPLTIGRPRGRPRKKPIDARQMALKMHRRKSSRFDMPRKSNLSEVAVSQEDTFIVDGKDRFCWVCHLVDTHHVSRHCVTCPRVFHLRCIRGQTDTAETSNWSCPECTLSLKMESFENQSESMKLISADEFCSLLTRTIEFLSSLPGADLFTEPVDLIEFPDYRDHIVNPVHLGQIQANINNKFYGSTESFIADIKWLYHNSIIYNGLNSSLTAVAKSILVRCKSKMNQLERCVDCFKKSFEYSISESFLEPCRQPHLLVWAKFKGYPFWPSKVFHWKMDNKNNCIVEVKFFNDYSRAWVPAKSIYLFSKTSPVEVHLANSKDFKSYQNALVEVQRHVGLLMERFRKFVYAPTKTEFNPDNYKEHLQSMLPEYDPVKLQARNTIVPALKSTPENKKSGNNEQDSVGKRPANPKSLPDKKVKRLKTSSNPDSDVGHSGSDTEGMIKQPKITLRELDNDMLTTSRIKLVQKRSESTDTKEPELVEKQSIPNKEIPEVKGVPPTQKKDSTLLKKMLLSNSNDFKVIMNPGKSLKQILDPILKDHLKVSETTVHTPNSDSNKKFLLSFLNDTPAHERPNLDNSPKKTEDECFMTEKPRSPIEKTSQDMGSTKFDYSEFQTVEAISNTSAKSQKSSTKDSPQKDSVNTNLNPATRMNRASNSRDSPAISSPEEEELNFNDLSERPIGLETEACSLRVNPTTFDHEGSATRLFNYSVQQLVPLVSEALSGMMKKLANAGNKDALIQVLRLELEEIQQKHVQEISSLKHVMNQQFLEYAHTSDIIRKQTEQKWSKKVAELEESLKKEQEILKKEQEILKTERETWRKKVINLTAVIQELSSSPEESENQE
ncbi:unnamed protein product [Bemisia tabaci]|uniref:Protein kinase C-binding protein 1 n=1 Tax=Bemisia tabaci TaxID=7038 RepID=A0A9P0AJ98_BEMTA|nr:unnamed protein product [Bemisia tabaci]